MYALAGWYFNDKTLCVCVCVCVWGGGGGVIAKHIDD